MTESWLDIQGPDGARRATLRPGLTRIGGAGADVVLPGVADGELHVWDEPPRLVLVAGDERPQIDGRAVEELDLVPGTRVRWRGHQIVYGREERPAVLEEIPLDPPAAAAPAAGAPGAGTPDGRAWARVRSGMLAELGLADRKVVKRWQEAVLRNEFDADAAARDLAGSAQTGADDPRVLERSGRLLRDFLMTSLQRGVAGASRKARTAAKSGVAMVIAQFLALAVFALVIFVILMLARIKWGISVDRALDAVAGR